MSLIAIDLLKEELEELESKEIPLHSYIPTRINNLRDAIQELNNIPLKSECLTCRYNHNQEELSELNEEEYINAFEKCRTCSNYYTNNFEEK
jgi:hypothetical protein